MKCDKAISLIHAFLDEELNENETKELRLHLKECESCSVHLNELRKTETFIGHVPVVPASRDLSERILRQLPNKRKKMKWLDYARRRPAVAAAAVFIIIMMISMFSLNTPDQQLTVKTDDLEQLQIEGNHVIVPKDAIITGDLVVENGTVEVDGKVVGDVTVIDGNVQMASTAVISGKVTRINQWVDRVWYSIFDLFKN